MQNDIAPKLLTQNELSIRFPVAPLANSPVKNEGSGEGSTTSPEREELQRQIALASAEEERTAIEAFKAAESRRVALVAELQELDAATERTRQYQEARRREAAEAEELENRQIRCTEGIASESRAVAAAFKEFQALTDQINEAGPLLIKALKQLPILAERHLRAYEQYQRYLDQAPDQSKALADAKAQGAVDTGLGHYLSTEFDGSWWCGLHHETAWVLTLLLADDYLRSNLESIDCGQVQELLASSQHLVNRPAIKTFLP